MQLRLDSPPKISFGITESCNLRCRHCYADCAHAPKAAELSAEQWIKLVDRLVADGIIQFYFEGGEPLAKPGFLQILERAARDAMTIVRTHGTLIDATTAKDLKRAGVGRVLVDLMGSNAETHDRATGTPGSFEASCRAVEFLVEQGIGTDILVILTRHTAPEMNAILHLAAELGAARVGVLRLYPLGRAKQIWSEIALSLEEQTEVIKRLAPPPNVGIMQSWHPHNSNCCWQAAAINAFGRAIGCMYLREYVDFGDAVNARYLDIWSQNPLYQKLRSGDVDRSCAGCFADEGTRGGCRSTAFAFSGRWDAADPFDTELNEGVDLRVLPERLL